MAALSKSPEKRLLSHRSVGDYLATPPVP